MASFFHSVKPSKDLSKPRSGDSTAVGLLANYAGKGVVALLTLLALPALYHQLQGEGFGLFGFFYSLLALVTLLDFGLSTAIARDLAADPDKTSVWSNAFTMDQASLVLSTLGTRFTVLRA